jgi:hypothetical protein
VFTGASKTVTPSNAKPKPSKSTRKEQTFLTGLTGFQTQD